MEKQCVRCSKVLDVSEFYVDTKCKSGYSSWCKSCARENINKTRRKHNAHIDVTQKECTNCHRILEATEFS